MLFKDAKTMLEAYNIGYIDGESSLIADLNILLEMLNLPFDTDSMSEFDAVRKMAEIINKDV